MASVPPLPRTRPARVLVGRPAPAVDGGLRPARATVGDTVALSVDVIRDGHEMLRGELRVRPPGGRWQTQPLVHLDAGSLGIRWGASVAVDRPGPWRWSARAWVDTYASWCHEVRRKVDGGQADLGSELAEGAQLLADTAERARGLDATVLSDASATVADTSVPQADRVAAALDGELAAAVDRHPDRSRAGELAPAQVLDVEVALARFGAWYELFPRSWGGLAGVRRRLPALAELGFDVVYLPPVSPIGRTNRKGPNNALVAGPDDPGSPWAIGDATGGHDAIHPDLGTVDDFVALTTDADALGLRIALDLALQCSADHPWLTEHPEWFQHRPDGTLKYAENPPKKYQDIYNLDWDCDDWQGLWQAIADVVLTWVERGVAVFRVDNPHTKPLPFWAWLIATVRARHPEVVFLAEAFTYRAMMQELAKVGFSQGYTYFTWKQSAADLGGYVGELAGDEAGYFRPNFFTNTPDILTEQLQHGGPAVFASRLVLAATLSPSYGIYSGFESLEHEAVAPGSEEYLNSEKYEAHQRTLDGPLLGLVAELNQIRRTQPALQHLVGTRILETESDRLLAYAKQAEGDTVVCVVLLDGDGPAEGICAIPHDLGLPPSFTVVDRLTGERFDWHVGRNYVRLVPGERPAHLLAVVGP